VLLSTRKTDPEAVQSSAHASTSQPIAIPAELSSPPPNQPRQLLTPALDSPFGSRQDAPTRASFSAYDSSTSGSDEGSLRGKLELYGRLPPNSAIGGVSRRVASMPLPSPFVSSSPRSPLSGGSFLNVPREELLRRTGAQSVPRHLSPVQPSHLPPLTFGPASHRRRSSASSTPLASFVGSYETSLLTGRMSAPPSLPIQFDSSIGVLGTTDAPPGLRCPPHLNIPFGASFYTGLDGNKGSSPYVGTIDLEVLYLSLIQPPSPSNSSILDSVPLTVPTVKPTTLPRFPGYRVPQKGQIQLVIKNPNSTAIKLFLIPYDIRGLDRAGKGGKTFLRQKSYSVVDDPTALDGGESKGRLRYAVHLQFCSPPTRNKAGKREGEPKYYLHNTIRVVFASRALDSSERLRVVAEGPEGIVLVGGDMLGGSERAFAPYNGPGTEWEVARIKAKGREARRKQEAAALFATSMSAMALVDDDADAEVDLAHGLDPDYVSESYEPPLTQHQPLLNTPPSPPSELSLGSLTINDDLVPHPPSPLSFGRSSTPNPLPIKQPVAVTRKSGLSTSRPGSGIGSKNSSAKTRWQG
jgi:hypothetical protein